MSGLFDILNNIKYRPGIYLGRPSISDLFIFLVGYKTARRELGIEPTEQEIEFYREFQPWIQKRFKIQTVNSWAKIIMLYSVDEKEGFTYFFKLLDEFLNRVQSLEGDKVRDAQGLNYAEGASQVTQTEDTKKPSSVTS